VDSLRISQRRDRAKGPAAADLIFQRAPSPHISSSSAATPRDEDDEMCGLEKHGGKASLSAVLIFVINPGRPTQQFVTG